MQALAAHADIALPSKQIDCGDDELLQRDGFLGHLRAYESLLGVQIKGEDALIDSYFRYNTGSPYAGFKSMPHRHATYEAFIRRQDIQFITLVREDVPSTVASFMLAIQRGTWRRTGREPAERWVYQAAHEPRVRALARQFLDNLRALAKVPNAVRVSYEQLCTADFRSREMERFFGRPIQIKEPVSPVSGDSYTGNWERFLSIVQDVACRQVI
jgi:hypothetical protein